MDKRCTNEGRIRGQPGKFDDEMDQRPLSIERPSRHQQIGAREIQHSIFLCRKPGLLGSMLHGLPR